MKIECIKKIEDMETVVGFPSTMYGREKKIEY